MKIIPDYDVVIQGPCGLYVKDGKIIISGIELGAGDKLDINSDNYFTVTSLINSEIESNCKIIQSYKTLGWYNVAKELSGGKIIVLGDENSGKTYFSNFLVNLYESPLIDSDVGQSSIFLPAFIAYSKDVSKKLFLSQRRIDGIQFFGNITPSTNPRLHIFLVLLTLKEINSDNVVIDSDGWVNGFHAYRHKLELIYTIDPDYILVFDQSIIKDMPRDLLRKAKLLKPFPLNVDRSRNKRREYRSRKYRDYFSNAKVNMIDMRTVVGTPISKNLIRAWNQYVQLIDEKPCEGLYVDRTELLGLYLGLTYKGKTVGAGLIKDIKEDLGIVEILTPVENFDGVILGEFRLNESFTESRVRVRKCLE